MKNVWKVIESDPLDVKSDAGKIVKDIRKFKNLWENVPTPEQFLDP